MPNRDEIFRWASDQMEEEGDAATAWLLRQMAHYQLWVRDVEVSFKERGAGELKVTFLADRFKPNDDFMGGLKSVAPSELIVKRTKE